MASLRTKLKKAYRTQYHRTFTPLAQTPTVCPAHDSARILSYQELPTSIQLWRGHGQEANRGEAGGPRITRHEKRWGRFSSRVRPPGCPWSWCGATPRGQPWTPAVTRPQGCDGLSMRRMAVLWPVREPSLGRQVHRQLMRNELARFYHHHARKCLPPLKLRRDI